ncbi:MAG TPA: alpha/beta fold hydrolase [Candidatus Paceibacterota bacterium]|jgi:hypothetical protein
MKRVFIVHGWDGSPVTGWFPWLKSELEARGFLVHVPQLPDTECPRIEKWVPALAGAVGAPDEDTYFVGHSMGCQTIARYLETLPDDRKVGGVVFVAGFFRRLTGLDTEEERELDREWAEAPLNFEKVRLHMKRSVALFSDDDPCVPVTNAQDFDERLGADVIIQSKQSHFNEGAGFKELPIVLEKVLELAA